ncbi:MAG: hypothetical protein H6739_03040 [Alphaproteobacteria bacterium]|nr:hypothetical protein [Alphaproteobacteria bacterium]
MDFKRIRAAMARLSAISFWVFAAGMVVILNTTGPYLAMGVRMYGGEPEPEMPDLPFPWTPVLLALTAAAASMVQDWRGRGRRYGIAAQLLSLGVAGLELWWFLKLIDAAAQIAS